MKLLKELETFKSNASNVKASSSGKVLDKGLGSDDVKDKIRPDDVKFSMMRNTINSDGEITGKSVSQYLDRAAELNDEDDTVETIPFGLETEDGDVVKVYVNAEHAQKAEEALKKLLGLEDDIEETLVKLVQEYDIDIIDVVWPKDKSEDGEVQSEPSSEDGMSDDRFEPLPDDSGEMEEIAKFAPLPESILQEIDGDEPTPIESDSFQRLQRIVANLKAMSSAGVASLTNEDSSRSTKYEMIARHVQSTHAQDVRNVREWMKRIGEENLPFWLRNQGEE